MVKKPVQKLFVEGCGENNSALQTECRRAFRKLLEKSGFTGRMPRIVACGNRRTAYDQFCTALEGQRDRDVFVLLVDSESAVTTKSPWEHVKNRKGDGWPMPSGASDDHLHLMVECMEAWFLADREALRKYFGQGYRDNALPSSTAEIEKVRKRDLYTKLAAASRATTTQRKYGKGQHSFDLLARLDPERVRKASPWAERFFSTLDRLLSR